MGWRLFVYCILAIALTVSFLFITIENESLSSKENSSSIFNAKEIKIRSSSKNKEIFYSIESEMINALSNSNNLSIFKPQIEINNKDSYQVKLSANKGDFFFERNQFDLSENIKVNIIKDKEEIDLFAEKVFVDIDKEYLSSKNMKIIHNDITFSGREVLLSDELISMSGNPISFAKKNRFEGYSNEIRIDLKKKLLYLTGTSNILIDGKNITGEDIIFDYKNNNILNSENLRIKSGNS
ncbi:LPS export ABC transporter periplasmic protein LptC [SAR86 cluster bacterium]|nr:LPS export ABC transporter periplasmic protein LptC [SAR86 cluster bacterium]